MCGRYTLIPNVDEMIEFFELPREIFALLEPRYNIAPTQPILVIHAQNQKRQAEHMLWGLIPTWSPDGQPNATLINARSETLAQKPSFRTAFKRRRCIIPSSGFYEWQKLNKTKHAFYIQPAHEKLFAFAGLWDEWQGLNGENIRSCTIITTQANTLMEPFHDRMPVILQKPAFDQWLDSTNEAADSLMPLLKPFSPADMRASPVSSFVNSTRNEGPKCLEPATPEQSLF
jgi:putative SOS response-associated peptidase YedK